MRIGLAKINGKILEASDWLEDELNNETDTTKIAAIEKLRKVTNQLVSRSEVTRKVLVDDMANSRYYEQRWLLDPARIISLVFVGPVGIDTFIEKFVHVANADKIGHQVGESAVAVGVYLAFKKHADSLVGTAYKRIKKAPADPPPINESGSGVILDRIRTSFMEQKNGEEAVHGRADHRAFAAC